MTSVDGQCWWDAAVGRDKYPTLNIIIFMTAYNSTCTECSTGEALLLTELPATDSQTWNSTALTGGLYVFQFKGDEL